jgi:predicted glycosyltransferase
MPPDKQEGFRARAGRLANVFAIIFDAHIEHLMEGAAAVVAMGGYNTFCDILSFDKPALILPRTQPRLEQAIRAARAQELGFVAMLPDDGAHDPARMATALRQLPQQARPSSVVVPGVLDGLDNIGRLVRRALTERRRPAVVSA